MGKYGVHDPSATVLSQAPKCIFFCFLSNKREERDYLLSLFVLLYVELASFGTPPTPHTHARRHHKPRHSPHHAHSWEGGDVDVLRRRHIPGAPALDRPLLGASWERRAMRYVVRRTHKPRHSPHHATLGRGAMGSYGVHDTSPPPLLIAPSWEALAWERRAMRS